MPPVPEYWRTLCQDLVGLSTHQTWLWWQALCKSRWSTAQAVRQAVEQTGAQSFPRFADPPEAERRVRQVPLQPQAMMQLVEELVRQHLLLRADARDIEEQILRRLDAAGHWCIPRQRR